MKVVSVFACLLGVVASINSNPKEEVVQVPMSDGTLLKTVIVYPKGYRKGVDKYPVVIDRSPYGYEDLEWMADLFVPAGFVAIGQDMRGTEMSQGNFSIYMNEAQDYRDAGDWIVKQEWSNGKIYTFGASADGICSIQAPRTSPPWLAGQYITWAPARLASDILYPFGAYKQVTTEDWLMGLDMPNPDVVYQNIADIHANEGNSAFWQPIELDPANSEDLQILNNIKFPSGFWAGWYDLFMTETLKAHEFYNDYSDPSVAKTSILIVDPLGHCQDAASYFPQNAIEGRTMLAITAAYQVFGIRPISRHNVKNVTWYVMSSNDDAGLKVGQYWVSAETWPVPKMTKMFMHSDKTLSLAPPLPTTDKSEISTQYIYDPANFQPTNGGNNLPPSMGGTIPCGPLDQGEIDQRSDVLVFQTDPLDYHLPLTGTILATLYVSSDAVDTDFMVRMSDVYPTGEVRLIQDNAFRMRWRNGGPEPVYMTDGEVYKVEMNLWNTSYIFAKGHSLRVAVSSSNNPRFSVNPNNGILFSDPNYPGPNITATNTLYHSTRYPSSITLPIVDKLTQLPEVNLWKEIIDSGIIDGSRLPDIKASFQKMIDRIGKKSSRKV